MNEQAKPVETSHTACGKRVEIGLGYACNNRCLFCSEFYHQQDEIRLEAAKRLTTDYLKETIGRFHAEGYRHLTFLGGEPTIRKDFPELVRHAKAVGFETLYLTTNGRMLRHRAYVDALFLAGLTHLNISLHGHMAETHDRIVQSPGAFAQVLSGIGYLLESGRRFSLTAVINSINAPQLVELMRLHLSFRPERICWAFVRPIGAGYDNFFDVVPRFPTFEKPLAEALDLAEKAGVVATVANVPFCFLKGHEGHADELYWGEAREWRTVNKFIAISDSAKTREAWIVTSQHHKDKGESCKSCRYFAVCDGVVEEYPRYYGFDEFVPVAGEPVLTPDALRRAEIAAGR